MTPSPQQQAVYDWVSEGRGSAFVEAVAGAGKTTTLLNALERTRGFVNFTAFNKAIAEEIASKAAKLNLGNRLRVGTFHSFGFGAWRRAHSGVQVDERLKRKKLVEELVIPSPVESFVFKLVGLAKQQAFTMAQIEDLHRWWAIVEHHDMENDLEDPTLAPLGVDKAQATIKAGIEMADKLIDFDDMLFMPVFRGTQMWQNDWILVDEAQDTNAARRALARKMLKPNGRAIFVGDRHQAIYGFTGADNDAVDLIVHDFNCATLPLTITYRCPKSVVAEARNYVEHIEAAPTAPEGEVKRIDAGELLAQELTAADAILCRKTKPLVETAYLLIRKGIPCHVEGREIGEGLIKLVKRFPARSMKALRNQLEVHRDTEVEKLKAKGKETQAEAVSDRVETIFVLIDSFGCKSVDELCQRVSSMFEDANNERKPSLTLATVHKAKGREWGRVFVLGYDTYMPSPWARQQWQMEQEINLIYVAYTRSKDRLVLVRGPEKKD